MPTGNHNGDYQVNTLVTDSCHHIGDNEGMDDSPLTPLAKAIAHRGIRQADLAKLAGTSKQQIFKLCGRRHLSPAWAKRLAPHLGVPWLSLIDGEVVQEPPSHVEQGVVVGESDPAPGDRLNDPDELALIGMWRKLTRTKRAALFAYLGADDMPSLK
jgi:transcriptional regulator with XRE-family HTH domain